jgi:hypothetical protein
MPSTYATIDPVAEPRPGPSPILAARAWWQMSATTRK